MNLQALAIKEFGNAPWPMRLVGALFGILTVLGIYFFTRELFYDYAPRKVAILSMFLTAVNFWHLNFSRMSFRAIMAPFFAVWAMYFLLLAIRQARHHSKFYILNSIFYIPKANHLPPLSKDH